MAMAVSTSRSPRRAPTGNADVVVLLNQGGGVLQPSETISVDSNPSALVAGDFGNGHLDLAVASSSTGMVSLFEGDGTGQFGLQPWKTFDAGVEPAGLVASKFGSGFLDLAVADQGDVDTGLGQGVSIFLNDGQGNFRRSAMIPVGSRPDAIASGDFNNDGRTDLAVADFGSKDVSVLIGNGNGTFNAPKSYAVGESPVAIVAGDFNGDGHTDLAVANFFSGDLSVLLGNGDGTFQVQVRSGEAGGFPQSLAVGDFNDDGRLDLAVGDSSARGSPSSWAAATGASRTRSAIR